MAELFFRPLAEADLANLYHHILESSGSPDRAIGYVRRIRDRCRRLLDFPDSGRSRDDLRPGLRIVGFERRLVIAYTTRPSGDVEIGRIFYGGRDYETLLEDEG